MKKSAVLLLTVFLMSTAPAWGASRSATFRVSCTVMPVMQVSSLRGAESNLKNNYSVVETFEKRAGVNMKILSVTAL